MNGIACAPAGLRSDRVRRTQARSARGVQFWERPPYESLLQSPRPVAQPVVALRRIPHPVPVAHGDAAIVWIPSPCGTVASMKNRRFVRGM